jgi:hypothetical protein
MRGILLAVVGLLLGALGALGYSHYLGEGKQLADAQAALADAQASLMKAASDAKQAKTESKALSDQVNQLTASKDDLQKQLDAAKTTAAAPAPAANPFGKMGGMMKAALAGKTESQLLMLKMRLHLTPEQEAAVKAALEALNDSVAKTFASGRFDSATAVAEAKNHKSLDQTLDEILTPEQKTEYAQIKTEQKNSSAEMMASVQLNQMAPGLNLTDTQKDQVYSALAQTQLQSLDPDWIKANINANDPSALLDARNKAQDDAMAKILTPDQLVIYQQQQQSDRQMQKAMMKSFSSGAGGGTTTIMPGVNATFNTTTTAVAPSPAPNSAPAATPASPTSTQTPPTANQ